MIDNNPAPGYFYVRILANSHSVASFFCPTLADAKIETERIARQRAEVGLPTKRAFARDVLSRTKRGWKVGPKIELLPN